MYIDTENGGVVMLKYILTFILIPYIALSGFKELRKVNIDPNPSYDNYDRKEIVFSSTLKSVAYPVKKDNKVYISLNGKTGDLAYDCISAITFLPGTERVAFLASRDGCKNLFWAVDGKEYSKYFSSRSHAFAYSARTDSFSYVAYEEKEEFVVINGKPEKKRYDRIDFITYMPDGETLLFKAKEKDSEFLVLGGKEQKKYRMIRDIRISEFSDIYYLATDGSTEFLVINGKEQQKFAGGVYYYCTSKDARKFITISNDRKNIIVNTPGKTQKFPLTKRSHPLFCTFAPDSKYFAFIAPDTDDTSKTALFINGNIHGVYDEILWSSNPDTVAFSHDSSKFAYVIKDGKRETLFVNDKKIATHDKFYRVIFSPDSGHIVFSYQDKDEQIGFSLGLDGRTFRNISSIFESPEGPKFLFDGSDRVRYIYEDNSGFYFVEEIIE